jgi:hypothetical protein
MRRRPDLLRRALALREVSMMRNALPVVSLLLAAALPSSGASAQQIVPFVGGGVALGMGDVGDDSNTGWLVVGGFDVPLPVVTEGFGVGVSASYANVPYQGGFSEAMKITSITAELSYLIGDATSMVRPYVRGGGGVQIHRYDPGDIDTNEVTDTRAGFTGGAGVRIAMGAADAMVGARLATGTDGGFLGVHVGVAVPVGP